MFSRCLALSTTLFAASVLLAQEASREKTPLRPTREQIARWIAHLGHDDFKVREEASRNLWTAGEAGEAALREAAASKDAEISRRSKELVDRFQWGLYPGTPKAVANLIGRYRSGEGQERTGVVRELLDVGPAGYRALFKILAAEETPEMKKAVLAQVEVELPATVPQLLAEKDFATLEALLAAVREGDRQAGLGHCAAYWLLRGQLDQKIDHYKSLENREPSRKENAEILACLYRARGDLAAARAAARRADREDLVHAMLYDVGDWKEEGWPKGPIEGSREVEKLGYRMACRRLAGQTREFEAVVAEVCKLAANTGPDETAKRSHLAKVLFLNQRPKEALEVLGKNAAHLPERFECLVALRRYAEALALVEKARDTFKTSRSKEEKASLELILTRLEFLEADTLCHLGEREKARPIFARLTGKGKGGSDQDKEIIRSLMLLEFIEAECRGGLVDEAFEHAAEVLAEAENQRWSRRLFGHLFPKREEIAESLWSMPQVGFPEDNVRAKLKRLRKLLAGKASRQELLRWIANAEIATRDRKAPEEESWWLALARAAMLTRQDDLAKQCLDQAVQSQAMHSNADTDLVRLQAIGETAAACKQAALAAQCLEKAATVAALLQLGDLRAGRKEWARAALVYYQAWQKDRQQALPLYLSGKALVKAGREKEGRLRMEQARWLPLGNEALRHTFFTGLAERGDTSALRRECELLFRLGQPGSWNTRNALMRLDVEASQRNDPGQAADYMNRFFLGFLASDTNWSESRALVLMPAMAYMHEVGGFLAAGKTSEGLALLARHQEVLPGYENLAILVVPQLEKLGKKKEADDLFGTVVAVSGAVCKQYPGCALMHNSYAWASAGCKRNLDAGLEHARAAVELSPDNPEFLDTLAEVYFQRGDHARALETMKKALDLQPHHPYYRKQWKRIEAGDAKAPVLSSVIAGGRNLPRVFDDEE